MCRISFGTLVFALVLAEVTSWTIDLPEARKFIFEKNDLIEKERHEEDQKVEIERQVLFSNRFDSNSKHHEKPHRDDDGSYAKHYGYHSYMEKKVRDIVYDGSEYLEGLQKSIENFTQRLENCTRMNQTNAYRFNFTSFNISSLNSPSFNTTLNMTSSNTSMPWRPTNEMPAYNETNTNVTAQCRRITGASEHVRRLAELAIKATKELQDIAYSKKHLKDDPQTLAKAENELILKLAWFLDRLAYYTDFRPKPRKYKKEDYSLPIISPLNATEALKLQMMNCLKQKSEVPATIRCAYPPQNQNQLPGVVQFMINNTVPSPGGMPASSNRNERVVPIGDQELLITSEYRPKYLTAVTHVQKRSIQPEVLLTVKNTAGKRSGQPEDENLLVSKESKMAAEDPAITFMNYYVKHKIWENNNPKTEVRRFEEFEVPNQLPRTKRDTNKKLQIPEDPFQDLSKYVKNKKGVNYVKDEAMAARIRAFVNKITNSKKTTPKEHSRRISKLFRAKRSYTYERDVDKPRNPDDLFKDISYYVKNKPGTNFNRDLVQAGQVRAGLEGIFLNPDIQTVRMFGANYNPLIPDPLMFAALRSAADN